MNASFKHPGALIKKCLMQNGIYQHELAKESGVSDSVISEVISGKIDLTVRHCCALERLGLGKAIDWWKHQCFYEFQRDSNPSIQWGRNGRKLPNQN